MITLEVDNDVEYGLLEESEADGMTGLLATAFNLHDPPAVAVGLPATEIERLVAAFAPKAVSEQLTVIARHRRTGTIDGALASRLVGTWSLARYELKGAHYPNWIGIQQVRTFRFNGDTLVPCTSPFFEESRVIGEWRTGRKHHPQVPHGRVLHDSSVRRRARCCALHKRQLA